jgi:uncharacterized membrane protein
MSDSKEIQNNSDPEIPAKALPSAHSVHAVVATSYEGPIPPAAELAKYNQLIPDAAERILAMAEAESMHRRECEKSQISKTFTSHILGMGLATLLMAACIMCSTYFFYVGNPWAGLAFLSVPVTNVIGKILIRTTEEP